MKKLRSQKVDFSQISQYIVSAEKKLASAKKVLPIDEEAAYQLAYEAILKGALGLMLSHGVRPRSPPRPPHHDYRICREAGVCLHLAPGYSENALETAGKYLAAIRKTIQVQNPQIKLL